MPRPILNRTFVIFLLSFAIGQVSHFELGFAADARKASPQKKSPKKTATGPARYRLPVCQEVHDRTGRVIDYFCRGGVIRVWVPIDRIDKKIPELVVFLEDAKFYSHNGLDAEGIMHAIRTDIKLGRFARGGSTITQQLAKNLFFSKEKTILRKVSEVPVALQLERELTKRQILELYLNTIEWGPGVHGILAASRLYFDKDPVDLTVPEAWMLGLMIPNPKQLNLWFQPKGRRSLLKRAKSLASRWRLEKKLPRGQDKIMYDEFVQFLTQWEKTKPAHRWPQGRRYPAVWNQNAGLLTDALQRKLFPKNDGTVLKTALVWDAQSELAMQLSKQISTKPSFYARFRHASGQTTALLPLSKEPAVPPVAPPEHTIEILPAARLTIDSFAGPQ